MNRIEAARILNSIVVQKQIGSLPNHITSVESDSRKVKEGSLFVCIKGYTVDGHEFVSDVIRKGAKVIVIERELEKYDSDVCYLKVRDTNRALSLLASAFFDYPSQKLRVIGVTGTNGKTTITNIINDVLRRAGHKTGVSGTVCFDIDGEKTPSKNTTSDALTMQTKFADMVNKGVTDAVLEVSSHGLALGRLWGVDFQTVIFTNLTQDHLDFHGTMEKYGQTKGLLFSQLGNEANKHKTAILNADSEWSEYYESITPAKILTYGINNDSDFCAVEIEYFEDYTVFTLKVFDQEYAVESPFVGRFNVYNTLAAIAALYDRGMRIKDVIQHLKFIKPVEGRMERLKTNSTKKVYVDYAHTPDGIEKVIESVRPFTEGRILFVIGTGGNRDRTKRPIMAEKSSSGADFVIFTTDNPRFESYESILNDFVAGMKGKSNYVAIGDREEAIFQAIQMAAADDTIIIAGKGHENYQIIKDKYVPFNDKEVALKALKKFP